MRLIYTIALIAVLFLSCGKAENPVPNVSVQFQASLYSPTYSKLQGYGVGMVVPGYGIAGLILYHELDGSWAAYDRCSTYQPAKKCAVTIDANDLTATDPCSGSIFALTDGSVQKGPASAPLKSYAISVSNYEIFVSN